MVMFVGGCVVEKKSEIFFFLFAVPGALVLIWEESGFQ